MSTKSIAKEVVEELERAEKKFAGFNSSHEGYAVILEELDELWEIVKLNPKKIEPSFERGDVNVMNEIDLGKVDFEDWQKSRRKEMMREEAIQVAAMAMRFVKCICDEEGK